MSRIANRTVNRSTRDTFLDHLARGMGRQTEADIELNYSRDVVLLTSDGLHYGHAGVRHCAAVIRRGRIVAQTIHYTVIAEG